MLKTARKRRTDDTFEPTKAGSDYGRVVCVAARIEDKTAGQVAKEMGVNRSTVVRLVRAKKPSVSLALRSARALKIPLQIAHALVTSSYRQNRFWKRVAAEGAKAGRAFDFSKPAALNGISPEALRRIALYAYHVEEQKKTSKPCDICGRQSLDLITDYVALLESAANLKAFTDALPVVMATIGVFGVLEDQRHKRLRTSGVPKFKPHHSDAHQREIVRIMSGIHRDRRLP